MNSIKLRAWHKESKEFVYFDFNKAINDQYIARNIVQLLANKHPDGKDLLTQSTGLTDNDKNDIYYGDVYRVYGYGDLVIKNIHDVMTVIEAMGEGDLGDKLGDIYNNPELEGEE